MQVRKYLNMTAADLDKPVYRIMPAHRLLECFQKKRLVLVRPSRWDDPFENMLLASMVTLESDANRAKRSLRDLGYDQVYGQCWTLHRETDAMWRIYSPDKNGAKVRSTPRKLLKALQVADLFDEYSYVGRVLYKKQDELVSALMGHDLLAPDGSGIAQSLMCKRREFSHEREIRLIFTGSLSADVLPLPVDPNVLFEEIIFDPRMDVALYEIHKTAVKNEGFFNRIDQSLLYRPPPELVIRYPI